jgi:hypothetical protein
MNNYIKVTMSFSKIKSHNYAQNCNKKSKPQNRKQDLLQGIFGPIETYQSFQKVPLMMIVRRWHFSLDLIKVV